MAVPIQVMDSIIKVSVISEVDCILRLPGKAKDLLTDVILNITTEKAVSIFRVDSSQGYRDYSISSSS